MPDMEGGGEEGPGCASLVDSGPARTENTPTCKGRGWGRAPSQRRGKGLCSGPGADRAQRREAAYPPDSSEQRT